MSSFIRKLKRNNISKKRKDFNREVKSMFGSIPENCNLCDRKLDLKLHADSWELISEESGLIKLICDKCLEGDAQ